MSFHSLWIYNYTLMKKDYSDDAKIYLICKNIGIKSVQWDIHTDAEKRVYMQRKLWVKANAQVFIIAAVGIHPVLFDRNCFI